VVASSGVAALSAEPLALAAPEAGGAPPAALSLSANRPNPFRAETTIEYALPRATDVRLVIYDVRGRVVRTLVDGAQSAGLQRTSWDGRDESGIMAAAGTYVYRLEADGQMLTRKLSVLR
jgi:hypothetical protein